jgi:DNA-directed RNA polymerase specialized sigma54-like protein
MLQLSYLELTDFVYAEVQQNPLLELQERLLGKDALVDGVDDAERMTPRAVPEMLTGE